jgi:hypothetical protein
MRSDKITGVGCSKAFGNPSGHSSGINLFCTVVFLDLFHGNPVKRMRNSEASIRTFSWPFYLFMQLFFLALMSMMPLSRYILGVHSLDQIVYGSLLGVWAGLTCHLILRDHLINYFIKAIDGTSDHDGDSYQQDPPKRNCPILLSLIILSVYTGIAIALFLYCEEIMPKTSKRVQLWLANFKKSCGKELDYTYGLQNACLNGCAYMAFPTFCYIGELKRLEWTKRVGESKSCKDLLIRLLCFTIIALPLAIPLMTLKLKTLKSGIAVMFVDVWIPCAILGYLTTGGIWDLLVHKLTCGMEEPEEQE